MQEITIIQSNKIYNKIYLQLFKIRFTFIFWNKKSLNFYSHLIFKISIELILE